MSWAESEWKDGLSHKVLLKISDLENKLEKLLKESKQKQFKYESLEASLEKQKQKVEDEKTQTLYFKRENQSLAESCEKLESKLEKTAHDFKQRDMLVNSLETQLQRSRQLSEHTKTSKIDNLTNGDLDSALKDLSNVKSMLDKERLKCQTLEQENSQLNIQLSNTNRRQSLSCFKSPWATSFDSSEVSKSAIKSVKKTTVDDLLFGSPDIKTTTAARCLDMSGAGDMGLLTPTTNKASSVDITHLNTEISESKKKCAVLNEEIENAKIELVHLRSEAESKHKFVSHLKDETEKLKLKLESKNIKTEELEKQVKYLTDELNCQRHNAESTRLNLTKKLADCEKQYKQELSRSNDDMMALEKDLNNEKNKLLHELNSVKSNLDRTESEFGKVKINSDKFEKELKQKETAFDQLEVKCVKLENELSSEAQKLKKSESGFRQLESQLAFVTSEKSELIKKLENMPSRSNEELIQTQKELEDLQTLLESQKSMNEEYACKSTKEIEGMKIIIDNFSNVANMKDETISKLELKVAESKLEIESLEEKCLYFVTEINEIKLLYDKEEDKVLIEELKENLSHLQQKKQLIQEEYQMKLNSLQQELETAITKSNSLQENKSLNEDLVQQITDIESKLAEAIKRYQVTCEKLNNITSNYEDLQETLGKKLEELNNVISENNILEQEANLLNEELTEMKEIQIGPVFKECCDASTQSYGEVVFLVDMQDIVKTLETEKSNLHQMIQEINAQKVKAVQHLQLELETTKNEKTATQFKCQDEFEEIRILCDSKAEMVAEYEVKIEELTCQLNSTSTEVNNLKEDLLRNENLCAEYKHSLDHLNNNCFDLSAALDVATTEKEDNTKELKVLTANIERRLREYEEDIQNKDVVIHELRNNLTLCEEHLSKSKTDVDLLKSRLQVSESDCEFVNEELKVKQSEFNDILSKMELVQIDMKDKNHKLVKFESILDDMNIEKNTLNQYLLDVISKKETLEAKLKEYLKLLQSKDDHQIINYAHSEEQERKLFEVTSALVNLEAQNSDLRETLQTLEERSATLENTFSLKQNKVSLLQESIKEKEEMVMKLESNLEITQMDLEDMVSENEEKNQQLEKVCEDVTNKEAELTEFMLIKESECKAKQDELDLVNAEYLELQNSVTALKNKLEDNEKQFNHIQTCTLKEKEEQILELQNKIYKQEKEIELGEHSQSAEKEDLNEKIEIAQDCTLKEKEHILELQNKISKQEEDIANLLKERDEIKEQFQSVERVCHEKIEIAQKDKKMISSELKELNGVLLNIQCEYENCQKLCEQYVTDNAELRENEQCLETHLKTVIHKKQALENELDKSLKELKTLENFNKEKTDKDKKELNFLKSKHSEAVADNQSIMSTLFAKEAELFDLKKEKESWECTHHNLSAAIHDLHLQEAKKSQKDEISSLKDQIMNSETGHLKHLKEKEALVLQTQSELKQAQSQLSDFKKMFESGEEDLLCLQDEVDNMSSINVSQQKKIEDLETKYNESCAKSENIIVEFETLKVSTAAHEELKTELELRIENLQESLAKSDTKLKEISEEHKLELLDLTNQLNASTEKLKNSEDKVEELSNIFTQNNETVVQLQSELITVLRECDQLKLSCDNFSKQKRRFETDLKNKSDELEFFELQIEKLNQELKNKQELLNENKTELCRTAEDLSRKLLELDDRRTRITELQCCIKENAIFVEELRQQVESKDTINKKFKKELDKLKEELSTQEEMINYLKQQENELAKANDNLKLMLEESKITNEELSTASKQHIMTVESQSELIDDLNVKLFSFESDVSQMQTLSDEKDEEIRKEKEKLVEVERLVTEKEFAFTSLLKQKESLLEEHLHEIQKLQEELKSFKLENNDAFNNLQHKCSELQTLEADLKQTISSQEISHQTLQENIEAHLKMIASLEKDNETLNIELDLTNASHERLVKTHEKYESDLAQLQETHKDVQATVKDLKSKLEISSYGEQTLKSDLASSICEIAIANAQNEILLETQHDLIEDLHNSCMASQSKEEDVSRLNELITDLTSQLEKLKQNFEVTSEDYLHEIASLNQSVDRLNNDLAEKNADIIQIQDKLIEMENTLKERDCVITALKAQTHEDSVVIDQFQSIKKEYEIQQENIEHYLKELSRVGQLEDLMVQLETSKDSIISKDKINYNLQEDLKNLNDEFKMLKESISNLETIKIAMEQDFKSKVNDLDKTIESITLKNNDLQTMKESLQEQLLQRQMEAESRDIALTEFQNKIHSLKAELVHLQHIQDEFSAAQIILHEHSKLQEEYKNLKILVDKLDADNIRKESELISIQTELQGQKDHVNALKQKVSCLTETLDWKEKDHLTTESELQTNISELKEQCIHLQNQLEESTKMLSVSMQKDLLEDVQSKLNNKVQAYDELQCKLNQVEAELSLKEDELSTLITKSNNLKIEIKELKDNLQTVENEMSTLQLEKSEIALQKENLNTENKDINDELETVKKELEFAQSDIEIQKDRFNTEKQKIENKLETTKSTLLDTESAKLEIEIWKDKLRDEKQTLEDEIVNLRKEISKNDNIAAQKEKLSNELQAFRDHIEVRAKVKETELQTLNEELLSKDQEINTLTSEYDEVLQCIQAQLGKRDAEVLKLKEEVIEAQKKLSSTKDVLKTTMKASSELTEKLSESQKMLTDEQAMHEIKGADLDTLKTEKLKLRSQFDELSLKYEKFKYEKDVISHKVCETEELLSLQMCENETLNNKLSMFSNELDEYKTSCDVAAAEKNALFVEFSNLEHEKLLVEEYQQHTQMENKKLKDAFEERQGQYEDIITKLQIEISEFKSTLQQLQVQAQKQEERYSQLKKDNKELLEEKENFIIKERTFEEKMLQVRKEVFDMKISIDNNEHEKTQLHNSIEILQKYETSNIKLNRSVETLKGKLHSLMKTCRKKEEEVVELSTMLEKIQRQKEKTPVVRGRRQHKLETSSNKKDSTRRRSRSHESKTPKKKLSFGEIPKENSQTSSSDYEVEGLPQFVQKGFTHIPSGTKSPYIVRRQQLSPLVGSRNLHSSDLHSVPKINVTTPSSESEVNKPEKEETNNEDANCKMQ